VAAMRATHGSNFASVPGRSQPVVNRGADPAALDRRFARPVVAGNQENDAIASTDRLLESVIDGAPSLVEVHPMQVDNAVWVDSAGTQASVPCTIQRGPELRPAWNSRRREMPMKHPDQFGRWIRVFFSIGCLSFTLLAREGRNRRSNARPQLAFLRAQLSHVQQCPWVTGSMPRLKPTSRQRFASPEGRPPKRYRSGLRL
jgi:hypothetical protein